MPHACIYDAIVLRAPDVGEADRFCILFTRERGRLAVRARGVRRLHSRMGGALLPLCRTLVSVKELSGGLLITAAVPVVGGIPLGDAAAFFHAECGIEILLALLHDEHPLPDLFDATAAFLTRSLEGENIVLAFTLRTLNILGFLPDTHAHSLKFSVQELAFIEASRHFPLWSVPPLSDRENVRSFCASLLQEQLNYPLRGALASTVFCTKERDGHRGRDSRGHQRDNYPPVE